MTSTSVVIAGDLFVGAGCSPTVGPALRDRLGAADYTVVNLEGPVTDADREDRILKTGPHLRMPDAAVRRVLAKLGADLVTLANNHIMDYGVSGLRDTLRFCERDGVAHVGAGMDVEQASAPHVIERAGHRIAILNYAENEWASAGPSAPGASPLDAISNARQIGEASASNDYVIVIVHGGNEHNPYPSPRMVRQYRHYAGCGASAVVGHHTHRVSGYEIHDGVPIFYSLGNLLFPKDDGPDGWYSGLCVELELCRGRVENVELIPVRQEPDGRGVELADGNDRAHIESEIDEVVRALRSPRRLEAEWTRFIRDMAESYLRAVSPVRGVRNRYIRGILHRLGVHRLLLGTGYATELLNRIRCEAHRDVTVDVLTELLRSDA